MTDTTEKFRFEFNVPIPSGEKFVFDYMKLNRKNIDFLLDGVNGFSVFVYLFTIQKRLFTVNDVGVSSKTILHWKKMGLLLDNYTVKANGWAKFNFVDYLWLQVVKELRNLGVSLEIIKKVKETLIDGTKPTKSFEEYRQDVDVSSTYRMGNDDEKNEVADFLYSQNQVARHFSQLMTSCIMAKENGQIIVFSNGEAYFKMDREDILFKQYYSGKGDDDYDNDTCVPAYTLKYQTYICVSVTELILKYLILDTNKLKIPLLPLLSKEEKEILEFVRKDKVVSVTVRKKNGKINLLEATEQYKPAELNARLTELFLKEDYQDIEIKKENGYAIFKRTVKHKL